MVNYLPDTNRFKLAGPPAWWLRQLWDFDSSLVVIPSRQDCVYRLAQRRKLNLPEHIINDVLFQQSDTQMLASYSLVPVTTIIATCNWSNPFLFQELANRAPHRMGGAQKVADDLDARDAEEEMKKLIALEDLKTRTAKASYRRYRKAIGLGRTLFT